MRVTILNLSVIFLFAFGFSFAQQQPVNVPFSGSLNQRWVDSVLNKLTVDERIAQLFMVAAYSNRDDAHRKEILRLIQEHKVGGLVFFQGGPVRQAKLINEYQNAKSI